jgi:hypothetical protein
MSYGLKNARPTFVRAMHKTFGNLIRDLVEVYVDDIVFKVKSCVSLLDNLALVFDRLHLTRTKLNPDKCVFEVTTGKVLGFLVSYRRIEANPEKIMTIEAVWPPARIKDVQKLTRCLAALSRFIARLAERALPIFKLLRKCRPFIWTEDVEEEFQELKRYLTSPPVMVAPEPGEPLLLYIVATSDAMSMVLVAERPNPQSTHELGSSSAMVQGLNTRNLWRSRELSRQPGPSPRRPLRAPMTRQSWGPRLWKSHQMQMIGRSLARSNGNRRTRPPPPGGFGPSSVRCTTSARSSMRSRPGTWRSTSYSMQSSSPLGSCVATSKLTRSRFCLHTHSEPYSTTLMRLAISLNG